MSGARVAAPSVSGNQLNRKAKSRISAEERKQAAAEKAAAARALREQQQAERAERARAERAAKAVAKEVMASKAGPGRDGQACLLTEAELKAAPAISSIKASLTSIFLRPFINFIRPMVDTSNIEAKRGTEIAMGAALLHYDDFKQGLNDNVIINEQRPHVSNRQQGVWYEFFFRCFLFERERADNGGRPWGANECDDCVNRAINMVMREIHRLPRQNFDNNCAAYWAATMDRLTRTMHGLDGKHGVQRVLERVGWAVFKRAAFAHKQAHPEVAGLYAPVFSPKAHVKKSVRTALVRAIMGHTGYYDKGTQRAQPFPALRAETAALLGSAFSREFIERWSVRFLGGHAPEALDGHDGIVTKLAIAKVLRQWPMVPLRFRCFALECVEAIHQTLPADDRRRMEGESEPGLNLGDDDDDYDFDDDDDGDDDDIIDDAEPADDDDDEVIFDDEDADAGRRSVLIPSREITPRRVPILPGYTWRFVHFRFGWEFMRQVATRLGIAGDPNQGDGIAQFVKDTFFRKYARKMEFFGSTFESDGTSASVYFAGADTAEGRAKYVHSVGHKGEARQAAQGRHKAAKTAESARAARYDTARKSAAEAANFMTVWRWDGEAFVRLPILAHESAAELRARVMAATGWVIPASDLQVFCRLTPKNTWANCPTSGSLGKFEHETVLGLFLTIKNRYEYECECECEWDCSNNIYACMHACNSRPTV